MAVKYSSHFENPSHFQKLRRKFIDFVMDSSSSSSDEDHLLADVFNEYDLLIVRAALTACVAILDTLGSSDGDFSVNPERPKIDRLGHLLASHASLFRLNVGFTLTEFEELCSCVCPVLEVCARSTGDLRRGSGRPPKLSPPERLLAAILYLKHNSTGRYESLHWNYCRSGIFDDTFFVLSAVVQVLHKEIQWPDRDRRRELGARIATMPGCIGFVDGTLCRIRRPKRPDHGRYYNRRKRGYFFNNIVVIDHDGLFIYVEPGYAGSFHDVNCLRNSELHRTWRQRFTRRENVDGGRYFEYLLGDPGYLGVDMYILRRVDNREVNAGAAGNPVVEAFNKHHAGIRIQVEWGIGGLKNRFKKFLGVMPNRQKKFAIMFKAAAILTNFVHRRRQDFHIEELGIMQEGVDDDFAGNWF
jgi:hypothetical protein